MITPEATIVHYGGASETVFADKLVRLLRAKVLLIDMHFTPLARKIGRVMLYLWPVRRYLTHAILSSFGRRASFEQRSAWLDALRRTQEWW